jgi:repressor LexA
MHIARSSEVQMVHPQPPNPHLAATPAGLTDRQQQILDFVQAFQGRHGFAPSIREIGEFFQIRSTNGVSDHLRALEKKGFLQRSGNLSRSLTVVRQPTEHDNRLDLDSADDGPVFVRDTVLVGDTMLEEDDAVAAQERADMYQRPRATPRHLQSLPTGPRTVRRDDHTRSGRGDAVSVPMLGRVAAGQPILAVEDAEETLVVDAWLLGGPGEVFGLRVVGDSMIDAGILPGDLVFVRRQQTARPGEIAVAMLRGEATVKRWYPEADGIRLQPENQRLAPIFVPRSEAHHLQLLGVVSGVFRKF